MSSAFATLRPSERRLIGVVGAVLFIVINWMWVVPHFSDWSATTRRMQDAQDTIDKYQKVIAKRGVYEAMVRDLEGQGTSVPPEDQAIQFARTITSQEAQSRVSPLGNSRPSVRTNQFFIEQIQTISLQGEEKNLVDLLYHLGAGNSLVRVRGMSLHPDAPRQLLAANVTLVASFQKNPSAPRSTSAPAAAAATPAPATPATPATPAAPTAPAPMKMRTLAPDNLNTNQSKTATNRVAPVKK